MANTYTLIAAQTLASNATTVTFTSIPSTYTDLCIKVSARTNSAAVYEYMYINFNNTTYVATVRYLQGSGSGANSGTESTGYLGIVDGNNATANTFSNNEIYIPNYAGSNNKSYSVDGTMENNATESYMHLIAGLWSSTAAINQIAIKAGNTQSFLTNSTFYLYGVKNA